MSAWATCGWDNPPTTLSGGEPKRVKLAAHLALASCEGAMFIFDEPTTGLHFDDIAEAAGPPSSGSSKRRSLIVIEHNLDVIKAADWVIDLARRGEAGGRVVVAGTPETVARGRRVLHWAFTCAASSECGDRLRNSRKPRGGKSGDPLLQPLPNPAEPEPNRTPV